MNTQLDFLAVGDIVTDAFIKLQDASVECEVDKDNCKLCMRFGDKIPYDSAIVIPAVGNSPNASVSAHRLGLNSALMTDLGDDAHGKECIDALVTEGVSTDFVRAHPGMESNYHYVLRYQAERTILVKHHEYKYSFPKDLIAPKFLYLSSLAENSLPYHDEIADYLEGHPETKLAFQPGTFQMKLGSEKLARLYKLSYLFFCNKQEAQKILGSDSADFQELLKDMHALGPKIVIITDGPDGAYVSDGTSVWFGPMYPDPAPPVDRTGAGDSFSSTFTCALALGKTVPEALSWGPINSMNVVQHIGAQKGLLAMDELEKLLANAPADYVIKKIA
ncbi:hypothetical protein COB55_00100 [Candidatus Wolfebacteria bacterium]|nr:MAG: hypothetical protein COB55_00100 [Candidatus Wolfebacteria bacterium]